MASELDQKIIKQVEYYFSDLNLRRDKFLREKLEEDEGWVPLEVLLTFKRLAALSSDPEVVVNAIEKSENGLLVVSEDKKKVRRNPDKPLPEMNEERKKEVSEKTAYAKGFPLNEKLDDILTFLEPYNIEHVSKRTTKDKKFKGSCFIVFKDVESCKKFVELSELKYKEIDLIRKFQQVYIDDKKKEFEERKSAKKNKKVEKTHEKGDKRIEYPKGATFHFSGLKEGETLSREDIKEKIKEIDTKEVQFIDFKKGDLEGYVRFAAENDAVEFVKKLENDEMEVEGFKLKIKLLEGDEEEDYLKKTSDAVIEIRRKQKGNSKNRKRNWNFQKGGKEAKIQKTD